MRKRYAFLVVVLAILVMQPLSAHFQSLGFRPPVLFPGDALYGYQNPERDHLYIVFLNGLGTSCDGSPYRDMGFRTIRRHLDKTGRYAYYDRRLIMFSYNGGRITDDRWSPASYKSDDSFQNIETSVLYLRRILAEIVRADPRAEFVLVGHSLGGRIGFDYLAAAENRELDRIQGLLTLDAPLLGLGYQGLSIPAKILGLVPSGNKTSLEQLLIPPEMLEFREREVIQTLDSLRERNIPVITLASRDDLVIPSQWAVAVLPDGSLACEGGVVEAGRGYGTWLQRTGHVQIVNHPAALEALIQILDI